jgi:NitT/TauT family transport system substrate-binding protein
MSAFIIHTHGRLHEWIAEEKGYYSAEGLTDYSLAHNSLGAGLHDPAFMTPEGKKFGAYESYEAGRESTTSCACHWTVNMAASADHGNLYGDCYFVTPSGIMVPPESSIRTPQDLADVEIHVGYHSGSHYTTLQTLEEYLPSGNINLRFGGTSNERLASMVDRTAQASTVWGLQYMVLEQLGFRKIVDSTFVVAVMVDKDANLDQVARYYRALRRAQTEIDFSHQKYTHYYLRELPARYVDMVDVRRFGPGERLVYEPYSKEIYDSTHAWVEERGIFDAEQAGHGSFESAVACTV